MKCVRCNGSGLIEFTGGTHRSSYWMKAELVQAEVEATEEHPVYKPCPCRDQKPTKPSRESAAYA